MSKELIIPCTLCLGKTDYYWHNDETAHMLCDACFIDLNHQLALLADSDTEEDRLFVLTFSAWASNVQYDKVTPQSMLERFLVDSLIKENDE